MRIEARRQKELDEGVESGPLKRVFDSFCQSCQTSSCEEQEFA